MSALCPAPHKDSGVPPPAPPAAVEFRYTQTDRVVSLLHELGASLLVSTYQANKLLVVRPAGGGLSILVRTFDHPMRLAADSRRLAVGTRTEVWLLRNAPDIAPRIEPAGHHDACYLPRSCHVTGDIGIHEMAWATPQPQPPFKGRWREPARQRTLRLVATWHSGSSTSTRWARRREVPRACPRPGLL